MSANWVTRKRPARLECRIEFNDYEETREFLDRAADLSESHGYYPDLSFGRTHVSITLRPEVEGEEVNEAMWQYAKLLDVLIPAARTSD